MVVGLTRPGVGVANKIRPSVVIASSARKLAERIYFVLRTGALYSDPGVDAYETAYRTRVLRNVERRAKSLGFQLVEIDAEDDSNNVVS